MDVCTVSVSASQLFLDWAAARQARPVRPLSDESVADYRFIWNTWCQYLAGLQLPWSAAHADHVHRFLSTLPASRSARTQASTVTQSRYGRVLREVYALAAVNGWVAVNPVDRQALPSRSERHDSLVLNRSDWAVVLQTPLPVGPRWQSLRDASVLQLMQHSALTVGEVRGLDLGDVLVPRLQWSEGRPVLQQPLPLETSPGGPRLALRGGRDAQARTVVLEGACALALITWLQARSALPCPLGPASPLFVSRKGGGAGRLSAKSLFLLANHHLQAALIRSGPGDVRRYSAQALVHAGPATLRNSCIVRWLDAGMALDEVLARAGLKDAPSLLRLRKHVHHNIASASDTTEIEPS